MALKVRLNEAVDAMQPGAAQSVLELAEMLAERYPRKVGPQLVGKVTQIDVDVLRLLAEDSPTGICIVSWPSLEIVWSNNVYQEYFVDLHKRSINVGMKLSEILVDFESGGLQKIADTVAETGAAHRASQYAVMLPLAGLTYWNWSATRFVGQGGDDIKLLIQMNRTEAPALRQVA